MPIKKAKGLNTDRQQKFKLKMELFYKLSIGTIDTILETGLPKSTQNLLWYLCKLNPFGDHPVQISWQKAKEAIGISRATFYRALNNLSNAGLLVCGSLRGFAVNLKNETNFSKISKDSQECDEKSQECDPSLYIDLQTLSYFPDGQSEEKDKIPDPESNTNDQDNEIKSKATTQLTTAEVKQNSTAKPVSQGEEKCSAARRTKKRTEKANNFDWLPEGPWNIDGKLDPNFRDWLAKNWLSRYGGDFHDKQADVLAHFKKDPANLPIRWEQYHNEFAHRVENTKIRLDNGCQINEATQQSLITHQRAVTAALPPEMNPVAMVATEDGPVLPPGVEKVTRGLESVEPFAPLSPSKNFDCEPSPWESDTPADNSPTPDNSPEYTKLEDGTQLKVFQHNKKSEPVAESRKSLMDMVTTEPPKDEKQLRAMVKDFLKSFGGNGNGERQVAPKPKTELEELNEMLLEPALRQEAINRAGRSPDYKYCYDKDQIITVPGLDF